MGELRWPSETVRLTDSSFEEFVARYPLVLVDCWAEWCGPCRMLSPTIDALAKEMQGRVAFGKLNVDENHGVAMQYRIMSIPTMLIFKDGKYAGQIVGAVPKDYIKAALEKYGK